MTHAEPLFVRPGEKVCLACDAAKPLEAFHRDRRREDGRRARCADCGNARKRSDYARDPEPFKAHCRASYAKYAAARREYARNRLAENRGEINARRREAYPEHCEKRLTASQAWRDANREKVREKDRRYRERVRAERARRSDRP